MSADTKKDIVVAARQRTYLNKGFDGLKQDIIQYERNFYDDKIKDFSDSGLGGALVDMAAFVGDNLSFYLDHQFSELSPEDAVEAQNIQRNLTDVGVKITGASPAVVDTTYHIEVPAETNGVGGTRPMVVALPIILDQTVSIADNGTQFVLLEQLDFNETDRFGNLLAEVKFGKISPNGTPLSYILSKTGVSMSGFRTAETFPIGVDFIPFRQITLSNPNISQIFSVVDDLGNTYYEVDHLSQDTVYKSIVNQSSDGNLVKSSIVRWRTFAQCRSQKHQFCQHAQDLISE